MSTYMYKRRFHKFSMVMAVLFSGVYYYFLKDFSCLYFNSVLIFQREQKKEIERIYQKDRRGNQQGKKNNKNNICSIDYSLFLIIWDISGRLCRLSKV